MTRDKAIAFAERNGLPIDVTGRSPYSIDQNLWGRAVETGFLEDPWNAPIEELYSYTSDPTRGRGSRTRWSIRFDDGVPTAIDGRPVTVRQAIEELNRRAGAQGVGRLDMVEDRLVGIKSREVYEAPGAIALITAHRELEDLTVERDLRRFKPRASEQRWTELVYDGLWFSPLKRALDAFVDSAQQHVTGEVRLRLHGGRRPPTGRRSDSTLYDYSLATYDTGDTFDQSLAKGFVQLWGLPSRIAATRDLAATQDRPGSRVTDDPAQPGGRGCGAAGSPAARPRRWPGCRCRVQFDWRLAPYDLAGSRAHARVLHRAGLLDDDELARMLAALDELEADVRAGTFAPTLDDEDVHTALERGLLERLGPLGGKLRAGRSRNDQVATDLRLYLRDAARQLAGAVAELEAALVGRAERAPGRADARHDPPAARAAGAVRPPPARPRARAGPRPGPAARLGPPGRGQPARRRRAGRLLAPARPAADRAAELGFRSAATQLDRRGLRPRLRRRVPVRRRAARRAPVPARRGDLPLGDQRVRLDPARRRATRPGPRSCRRRRTRTSPSWPGARPAG